MNQIMLLLVISFTLNVSASEIKRQHYGNGQIKFQIEFDNGMLNGQYLSWYENGQIKAQGTFTNNQRKGIWKVWDSTGTLRITREYKNNFQFEITTLRHSNGEDISSTDRPIYRISKNEAGYIEYPGILEKDVLRAHRLWRVLEPSVVNTPIFDSNHLYELILNNTQKQILNAYDASSDEFEKLLTVTDINLTINNKPLELVGYKIKEEWFFNSNMQMSDTRIIGLCPIVKDAKGQEMDLFWIYYPDLRELLAAEQLAIDGAPYITTLEDLFQYRHFESTIYKETNIYDREIETKEEAEQIEMNILDMEHEIWIWLISNKE